MDVFAHLIYEYQKRLRSLALYTFKTDKREYVERKLQNQDIDYFMQIVSPTKLNVFFGDSACVNVVRKIGGKKLNEYSPEEDFILGIMLGYDRVQQCERYLKSSKRNRNRTLYTRENAYLACV